VGRIDVQCEVLPTQLHWRGAKTVLRKNRADRTAGVKQEHRQVFSARFAYAGFSNTPTHAWHWVELGGGCSNQIDRHGNSPEFNGSGLQNSARRWHAISA
jgi:hypothetical protein